MNMTEHTLLHNGVPLHYEPSCTTQNPVLLMVGDQDATGNIRSVKHTPYLDASDVFHRHPLDFFAENHDRLIFSQARTHG